MVDGEKPDPTTTTSTPFVTADERVITVSGLPNFRILVVNKVVDGGG